MMSLLANINSLVRAKALSVQAHKQPQPKGWGWNQIGEERASALKTSNSA